MLSLILNVTTVRHFRIKILILKICSKFKKKYLKLVNNVKSVGGEVAEESCSLPAFAVV